MTEKPYDVPEASKAQCNIRKDGAQCPEPATHFWGSVFFCCDHFSAFVEGMFGLRNAVDHRRHEEWVKMYEQATQRTCRLIGKMCGDKKTEE